jgi:hypothetical protein
MSIKPAAPDKAERLKIVLLDDDRLSSHNLGIQLKFVSRCRPHSKPRAS